MTENKTKKIRLNVLVSEDQYKKLEKIAKHHYRHKSKQIRSWIDKEQIPNED